MADAKSPRDARGDAADEHEEIEEEPELSLTKLINRNNELIQGLKQQLARAKRKMTEGA